MFINKRVFIVSFIIALCACISYIKYIEYILSNVPSQLKIVRYTPYSSYKWPYIFDSAKAIHQYRQIWNLKYESEPDLNVVPRLSDVNSTVFAAVYDSKWPAIVEGSVDAVVDVIQLVKSMHSAYTHDPIIVTTVKGALDTASAAPMSVSVFLDKLKLLHSDKHWVYAGDEWFLSSHPQIPLNLSSLMTLLGEDLFQLFPQELQPWGPMLLWGSPYSRSFLHIDPYNWTGLNFVLKGHKKWKLFPPGQDSRLSVRPNKKCGFPLDCIKYNSALDAFDPKNYELLTSLHVIEVDQYPGDLLVIPTGWFHQAYNVKETIAVASQVVNAQNYRVVLEEIIKGGSVRRKWLGRDLEKEAVADQARSLRQQISRQIRAGVA